MSSDSPVQTYRLLIRLDMERIVSFLRERRDLLITVWSRHRSRDLFLQTLFSRVPGLSMTELAMFPPHEIEGIEAFYRVVDDFQVYCQSTEDMPATVGDRYDSFAQRLEALFEAVTSDGMEE